MDWRGSWAQRGWPPGLKCQRAGFFISTPPPPILSQSKVPAQPPAPRLAPVRSAVTSGFDAVQFVHSSPHHWSCPGWVLEGRWDQGLAVIIGSLALCGL